MNNWRLNRGFASTLFDKKMKIYPKIYLKKKAVYTPVYTQETVLPPGVIMDN